MRLTTKLEQWQEAGLLTADQAAAIVEHEKHSSRFSWQNGLYFLAVFAIVIGILAIIAANWQVIPGGLKIGVHLLVNCLLGIVVLQAEQAGRQRAKELCLLAWFGLNVTLIGLIGQVFHLGGDIPGALMLWLALSSPAIVMLSNSSFTLILWLWALLLTLLANYGEHVDPLVSSSLLAVMLFAVLVPVAMAALSQWLIGTPKTELQRQLANLAPLLPVLAASIACQFWYNVGARNEMAETQPRVIGSVAMLVAVACSFYPRVAVSSWLGHAANLRLLLLGAIAAIASPYLFYGFESGVLAALTFIAFWLLLGYLGHRSNVPRLISLAILVVTVRIYIVYLEVFGSLLQTGLGLIVSGVLLLGMLKLAQLLNRNLRNAPHAGGTTP